MPSITFDALSRLAVVDQYQQAFYRATAVSLKLVAAKASGQSLSFGDPQNAFCKMISGTEPVTHACCASEAEARLRAGLSLSPQTVRCFAGLQVVAAPVVVGGEHLATWLGGQVFFRKPTPADFEKVAQQLAEWGFRADLSPIRAAFFETRVMEHEQFQAIQQLLALFAEHLGECADRAWAGPQFEEPQCVTQAKAFLQEHLPEPVTLGQVAAAAHLSPYHFCRVFRKSTGLTLTEYLSRLRVQEATRRLNNPSARVSEVAFAVGFGSISQFNTLFRKWTGQSPTEYRRTQSASPGQCRLRSPAQRNQELYSPLDGCLLASTAKDQQPRAINR